MKKLLSILIVSIAIIFAGCTGTRYADTSASGTYNQDDNQYYQQNAQEVSYAQFYDQLNPYGRWINYPGYGNAWIPMDQGFRPYSTNGHWSYTNYGWTWVSGYQWGWAPFHYGRWFHDSNYGWVWTPGYEWAPAWVNWRSDNQYYGWAPLGPQGRYQDIDDEDWSFVNHEHLNDRNLDNYYINRQYNRNIINNTSIINNNVGVRKFNPGPSVREVEAVTNSTIRPLKIQQTGTPSVTTVNNGTLTIYKPTIKNDAQGAVSPSNQSIQLPRKRVFPSPKQEEMPGNRTLSRPVNPEPVKRDLNKVEPRRPVMIDMPEPIIHQDPTIQNRRENIQRGNVNPSSFPHPVFPANTPARSFPQQPVVRERMPAFPQQARPAFPNTPTQQPVNNGNKRKSDGSF